jgi:outer membrane protein assembly factor BamB
MKTQSIMPFLSLTFCFVCLVTDKSFSAEKNLGVLPAAQTVKSSLSKEFGADEDFFQVNKRCLECDSQGNVIVSLRSGIVKCSARDGAVIWSVPFSSLGVNGAPSQRKWQVDEVGNVIVYGTVGDGQDSDAVVARIAGTDGKVLWKKTYSHSPNTADTLMSLILDSDGDVYASVFSGGPVAEDPLTVGVIKFSATDGKILWEHREPTTDPSPNGKLEDSTFHDASKGRLVMSIGRRKGSSVVMLRTDDGKPQGRVTDVKPNVVCHSDGIVCLQGSNIDWAYFDNAGAEKWRKQKSPNVYTLPTRTCPNGDFWMVNAQLSATKISIMSGAFLAESKPMTQPKDTESFRAGQHEDQQTLIEMFADKNSDALMVWYATEMGDRNYNYHPRMAKLSGKDGSVIWQKKLDRLATYGSRNIAEIDHEGNMIAAWQEKTSKDQKLRETKSCFVVKFSTSNGDILWQRELPLRLTSFDIDSKGNILLAHDDGQLLKVSGKTGEPSWLASFR